MSRIDELIAELCPNGVEYKKLGEVATISRGGSFQKKDFCEDGVPCIHYGQIYTKYGLFADKTITFISEETAKKQKFAEPNDIVMAVTSENVEDVCKCLAWIGVEKVAVSGHSAIIHHNQNAKYLCYYFHTSAFFQQKRKLAHGTKVIEVKPDSLKDVLIPLPPLQVQSEIVKILDNFTELTAELTARKKQYEYYKNDILASILNCVSYSVKDICDTITNFAAAGSFAEVAKNVPYLSEPDYAQLIRTVDIKCNYTNKTPIFISKHSYDYLWRVQLNEPCIVMPSVGNCGEVYYLNPDKLPYKYNALAKNALLISSSKANLMYLKYIFESTDFQKQLKKSLLIWGKVSLIKQILKN